MVDRDCRDRLAIAIRRLAAGLITNDEFEAATISSVRSRDIAARSLRWAAWGLYDDRREHRLDGRFRLGKAQRREIARWILFLKSNLEYEWPDVTRWLWLLVLPNLVTFGLIWHLIRRWHDRRGEAHAWPFLRAHDLRRAATVWPAQCHPQAEVGG
jgi:hypothetical protein